MIGKTILTWGDLRGNRQYISIGNAAASYRVCLFFMDYAHRRRLKIYGHMQVEELDLAADRAPALVVDTSGSIEHVLSVRIAGFDWNCPQHITQRFTLDEFAQFAET